MSHKSPKFSAELGDIVFAKTPKGWGEVAQRSTGLNGKQRSILIMLDGKKRLSTINRLLSEHEMSGIVDSLLALELIAPQNEVTVSATPQTATSDRAPTSTTVQSEESAKLLRIKSMIAHSAVTYLGLMAADVVRRVEQACDEAQLRSVLGHWHMAMCESKYGKDVASKHLEQIKASFRGDDIIAPAPPAM